MDLKLATSVAYCIVIKKNLGMHQKTLAENQVGFAHLSFNTYKVKFQNIYFNYQNK